MTASFSYPALCLAGTSYSTILHHQCWEIKPVSAKIVLNSSDQLPNTITTKVMRGFSSDLDKNHSKSQRHLEGQCKDISHLL